MLIPVISDLQVPLQDERAVAAVATFLADQNLDSVCVGDAMDAWQVSTWEKGRAGEFDGLLDMAREETITALKDLRVRHLSRSNHDERLGKYLGKYAPALADLPELQLPNFLRMDSYDCTYHEYPYEFAPGWLLMHGDEGSLISSAGGTALNLARKTGTSIACGHTHRLGMQHHTFSSAGAVNACLWGFEVGHLMDMTKAHYLAGGIGNWQQGFGVLWVDGRDVQPIPVPIVDGFFYFDGKKYKG